MEVYGVDSADMKNPVAEDGNRDGQECTDQKMQGNIRAQSILGQRKTKAELHDERQNGHPQQNVARRSDKGLRPRKNSR